MKRKRISSTPPTNTLLPRMRWEPNCVSLMIHGSLHLSPKLCFCMEGGIVMAVGVLLKTWLATVTNHKMRYDSHTKVYFSVKSKVFLIGRELPFHLVALPSATHGFQVAKLICTKLAEGKVLERPHGERFLWARARSACDTRQFSLHSTG